LPVTAIAWDTDCRFGAERRGSLDTSGAERVEILARAGDLALRPATGSTVSAEGRACASSEALLEQILLHVRREGNVVQVHVQVPERMVGIGAFHASLDLQVQVPTNLPVHVTDSSGDTSLDGVRVVRLQDSSGDIVARRLLADIEIDDSSGDLRIQDAAGAVRINDSSGDIVVRGAASVHIPQDSSGDISIGRVSGNVQIDQDSSGDIVIADVDGNVELRQDGSGQVRVTDVRGTVRVP
jgi:hypothetical protein